MRSRRGLAVVVGVVLMALGTCAVSARSGGDSPATRSDMGWVDGTPRLLAVDSHGAIALVETLQRGITRDGRTLWREPDDGSWDGRTVCVHQCPNAVSSGDLNELGVDPAPTLLADARLPGGWGDPTVGANLILAVDGGSGLRLVSNKEGQARLESIEAGKVSTSDFPATDVAWLQQSADRRSGVLLALPTDPLDPAASPFLARLTDAGWVVTKGGAQRACISPDGRRSVVGDTLTVDEQTFRLGAAMFGESCEFSPTGVVLGGALGSPEPSTLTMVGNDGATMWTRELPAYAMTSTSPVDDRVAVADITPGHQRVRVLGADGEVVAQYPGESSGKFAETGELVLLDTQGVARWLPR